MKKALFLINTYFQLITSIQLAKTNFREYDIDFAISDHSQNAESIVENINKHHVISNAYYVESKDISYCKNNYKRIVNFMRIINHRKLVAEKLPIDLSRYDTFLFHNMDLFTYALFEEIIQSNPNVNVVRFEEGFSIYLLFNDKIKTSMLCERFFTLVGKKSLISNIDYVCLFHPEYLTYDIKYRIEKIPIISKKDKQLIEDMNNTFGYYNKEVIHEKGIIFEDCFWGDGYDVKDYELFMKIADYLPEGETAIKLHPRNGRNRFKGTKCRCLKGSAQPWELIQMNNDYKDKIFFTIASGSVLASMLYFNEKIPTIFLYKIIDGQFPLKPNYTKYIENIKKTCTNSLIFIPESLHDLKNIVEDLNK